jgi:ribosomal protein S21
VSVRINLEDNETLDSALSRFSHKVYRLNSRRWYKRRYGYYEKPSVLARKRRKMWCIQQQCFSIFVLVSEPKRNGLRLCIDMQAQFMREGVNAVGK